MSKNKNKLTNVKENFPSRGRPAYPFRWPYEYEYTKAVMILAGLTYSQIQKRIKELTGLQISRPQIFNYLNGYSTIPAEIYKALKQIFGDYLDFGEVKDAE